jgi:hypothetical protein
MSQEYPSATDGDANEQVVAFHVERGADALRALARAVTADAAPSLDESGGYVGSLTEAIMGMTAALCRIANAIESLRDE